MGSQYFSGEALRQRLIEYADRVLVEDMGMLEEAKKRVMGHAALIRTASESVLAAQQNLNTIQGQYDVFNKEVVRLEEEVTGVRAILNGLKSGAAMRIESLTEVS